MYDVGIVDDGFVAGTDFPREHGWGLKSLTRIDREWAGRLPGRFDQVPLERHP